MTPLPLEMRERILMVVAEFGWSLDNPKWVVAVLMGHMAAIGIAASEAIDEWAWGIVRALWDAPAMFS